MFQYGWVLASLGDIGGTIKDNPIYLLSNTPLGRWPGEFKSPIQYTLSLPFEEVKVHGLHEDDTACFASEKAHTKITLIPIGCALYPLLIWGVGGIPPVVNLNKLCD